MLEIELGLLSDGSIGVERRLDAVPQYGHVHGHGGVSRRACSLVDDISCRRALAVGAVWAVVGLRASSRLPECPRLGAARSIRGNNEERARPAIWWFMVHPLRFASSLCRSGGVQCVGCRKCSWPHVVSAEPRLISYRLSSSSSPRAVHSCSTWRRTCGGLCLLYAVQHAAFLASWQRREHNVRQDICPIVHTACVFARHEACTCSLALTTHRLTQPSKRHRGRAEPACIALIHPSLVASRCIQDASTACAPCPRTCVAHIHVANPTMALSVLAVGRTGRIGTCL
jgi:hypothetical protein